MENPQSWHGEGANQPWLETVDHVTYVVRPDTIKKWGWWYIDVLGGKLTLRSDDVDPKGKSSMMLWTIDFGKFSIALVAGIDREEKSHVTVFEETHGDRTVQHVAYRPWAERFEEFLEHTKKHGMKLQSAPFSREEGDYSVKQVFANPSHGDSNPGEVGFDEFEARADEHSRTTFSHKTGTDLYRMAQALMNKDKRRPMLDWSFMPEGWEPPEVKS